MRIAVLVSGGVDSSVALKLLQDQGHDVTAFYLKIWLEDELSYLGDCPWEEDLAYVRAVCKQFNVSLRVMSLQKEYQNIIVAYTIEQIKQGKTPNPDMLCNQRIKFGVFLDAIGNEFDKVATGHYAQIKKTDEGFILCSSPDILKDQTYFLAHLSQEQLSRALFPIGHLTKREVRELAKKFDLPNKERKDSQGICFLGKLKFSDFVRYHVGERLGDLVEYETGAKIGNHKGFWFYTIGQRQGIGLAGGPWYVVAKDPNNNIVYISRYYYSAAKDRNKLSVGDFNWFTGHQHSETKNLSVKLRHGAHKYDCFIDHIDEDSADIILADHDQGIAPGQFAVFYAGNQCLGSAVIVE